MISDSESLQVLSCLRRGGPPHSAAPSEIEGVSFDVRGVVELYLKILDHVVPASGGLYGTVTAFDLGSNAWPRSNTTAQPWIFARFS